MIDKDGHSRRLMIGDSECQALVLVVDKHQNRWRWTLMVAIKWKTIVTIDHQVLEGGWQDSSFTSSEDRMIEEA